ncbi:hypothetical protein FN846DRAFT_969130 [Sphaerosporella brunnea]|uniref:Secreted protein n=1 Tax=Sphaerosporella brunnea TaxID=1250544 RepID=A0A5J5EKL2_9PEZI|nr:hypothetical protein FN846DRAFT_969130 [Sphaerosporella brunnea]
MMMMMMMMMVMISVTCALSTPLSGPKRPKLLEVSAWYTNTSARPARTPNLLCPGPKKAAFQLGDSALQTSRRVRIPGSPRLLLLLQSYQVQCHVW